MARKRRIIKFSGGSTWLDTYADTITLLLTFFVLLYSMSSLDSEKLKQLSNAFNEVMSGKSADSILQYDLYNGKVPLVGGESPVEDMIENGGSQVETYEEIQKFVEENDLSATVEITNDERGIILQLKDSILFEAGRADLKKDSLAILDKINVLMAHYLNSIIVEGHTDNVPVGVKEFESNWELGFKATKVLRYFTEDKGQNPNRFSAVGYGETRPLVPNNSIENKAKNRRVNILLVTNNKE